MDLSENLISDEGLKALIHAALQSCCLEELDLGGNSINLGLNIISPLLLTSSLRVLVLHSNEINDGGIFEFLNGLKNSNLQTLDLAMNSISDTGAFLFSGVLPFCKLDSLDLSRNLITDEGAKVLSLSMRRSNITLLNLENDFVSPIVLEEIEYVEGLVRREFKIMVTLCSVRTLPRLGGSSTLRMFPLELVRRIAAILYPLAE